MNKLIVLALVAGLAPLAFADGNTSTATAQASVTILAPVYCGFTGTLNFGKVVMTGAPTSFSIDNGGVVHPGADGQTTVFLGKSQIGTSLPSLNITKDASATLSLVYSSNMATGSFTPDPALVGPTGALTVFAAGNGTTITTPYFGSMAFQSVPGYGVDAGTVSVVANYN
jgi:spore coat protein U-like protein